MAIGFLVYPTIVVLHVRAGRVALLREWMIRSFVVHASVMEAWIRATRRSVYETGTGVKAA